MNLFQTGDFTLRSGLKSKWKIECDALTSDDWKGLAAMAAEVLPLFSSVYGVPRGGVPFEVALSAYTRSDPGLPVLIAEDVCTTGGSMERFVVQARADGLLAPDDRVIGVCVFARGYYPDWVTPLFAMPRCWPIKTGDGE